MSGALAGLRVLVAGATSSSGVAAVRALHGAGATVLAAGSDAGRLSERTGRWAQGHAVDLTSFPAVQELAERIRTEHGPLDGLVHLVGGWRGGAGIPGQSDEDWDYLHSHILTTLRNTSRAFYPDLAASGTGRLAIVSATATEHPTAGGANYAAAKAAAESWMQSVAQGFRAAQYGSAEAPVAQHSAAVTFVIKAFVDDAMRAADPAKDFTGHTDVADFGAAVAGMFQADAAGLNGRRIRL